VDPYAGYAYQIASWPDEDLLVAELWVDGKNVGVLLQRPNGAILRLYPVEADLDPQRLVSLIERARSDLAGRD
jgi:hypothetical protein